jgi:hypothetical protein
MAPSVSLTQDTLEALEASLLNTSGLVPLHDRFRALFTLKAAQEQGKAIEIIGKGVFWLLCNTFRPRPSPLSVLSLIECFRLHRSVRSLET